MTTIIVGFSRAKSKTAWFSRLIRWAENTPYSHVYIRRNSSRIGEYVYQASGTAVNFMGITNFLKKAEVIEEFELQISQEDLSGLLKDMIKFAGSPYSIKQVLKLSKYILLNKIGIKTKLKHVDGEETWICSEIAGWILKKHLHLNIEGVLDMLTPKGLRDQLVALGYQAIS